jgi:hypothetical protein
LRDAVGVRTSGESVRRVTEGWGKQREAGRAHEAARAMALAQKEERPDEQRLPLQDPIVEHANLSTDGVMVLLRDEGWKEVKLTVISAVEPSAGSGVTAHGMLSLSYLSSEKGFT